MELMREILQKFAAHTTEKARQVRLNDAAGVSSHPVCQCLAFCFMHDGTVFLTWYRFWLFFLFYIIFSFGNSRLSLPICSAAFIRFCRITIERNKREELLIAFWRTLDKCKWAEHANNGKHWSIQYGIWHWCQKPKNATGRNIKDAIYLLRKISLARYNSLKLRVFVLHVFDTLNSFTKFNFRLRLQMIYGLPNWCAGREWFRSRLDTVAHPLTARMRSDDSTRTVHRPNEPTESINVSFKRWSATRTTCDDRIIFLYLIKEM